MWPWTAIELPDSLNACRSLHSPVPFASLIPLYVLFLLLFSLFLSQSIAFSLHHFCTHTHTHAHTMICVTHTHPLSLLDVADITRAARSTHLSKADFDSALRALRTASRISAATSATQNSAAVLQGRAEIHEEEAEAAEVECVDVCPLLLMGDLLWLATGEREQTSKSGEEALQGVCIISCYLHRAVFTARVKLSMRSYLATLKLCIGGQKCVLKMETSSSCCHSPLLPNSQVPLICVRVSLTTEQHITQCIRGGHLSSSRWWQ